MEASASSLSSLRHRLRATVCLWCGLGNGGGGLGARLRWCRRAGVREFRYDPLSYALNFDEGGLLDGADDDDRAARRGEGFLHRSFSFSSAPRAAAEVA